MSPRRAVKEELSRERIIEAARKLFVQVGYQHVSMRKIAKELDYSHGAIYYHFANKAELFYAIVEEDFRLLDEALEEIIELNIADEEKLNEVLLGFIRFGLTHQSHYELMFLTKDDEVKSYINEGPNNSYGKFAQTIFNLTNKSVGPRQIWAIFLSLHGFVTHYCRSDQTYDDVKTLAQYHVQFLLSSLK